jgi:hypothetical protein
MIAETDRESAGHSLFSSVPTVHMLNMIALVAAVLWLIGSVGAVTTLADTAEGNPALWDYVAEATEVGEYLIVTVMAWAAAAILSALQERP